mmetsp:Transcript_78868/g.211736  ORF Transcript_78868/g.211736 Transcript_78868/m.211736 type:complete len:81 (-) Transcript_78868:243-485(-)
MHMSRKSEIHTHVLPEKMANVSVAQSTQPSRNVSRGIPTRAMFSLQDNIFYCSADKNGTLRKSLWNFRERDQARTPFGCN